MGQAWCWAPRGEGGQGCPSRSMCFQTEAREGGVAQGKERGSGTAQGEECGERSPRGRCWWRSWRATLRPGDGTVGPEGLAGLVAVGPDSPLGWLQTLRVLATGPACDCLSALCQSESRGQMTLLKRSLAEQGVGPLHSPENGPVTFTAGAGAGHHPPRCGFSGCG